ncbi:predicted protein [Streptomyces viridochromogenes DSM 40736]|uniref:Predicted protein n=1 Tax=Streptomyces viridochromogenes (strain DSM 40736 / JCM 4977 / BCRC 1201 / Tue 494) TaxID=591159 RepID=D9XGB8_STRVT|nr:predicted protein [Streptomyces viridochromogenes DSM 40736]
MRVLPWGDADARRLTTLRPYAVRGLMGWWSSAATGGAGLAAQIDVQSSHEDVGGSGHARHCA